MRIPCLLVLLATWSPAQQQENLVVNANFGTKWSGDFCAPLTCTPSDVATPATSPLQIATTLGAFQPVFLLVAMPPHHCTPLPGFGGSLMLQPPAQVLLLNPLWGHFPSAPCAGWQGLATIGLPPTLPAGMVFLVQVLAPPPAPQIPWTFSNAVAVTIL